MRRWQPPGAWPPVALYLYGEFVAHYSTQYQQNSKLYILSPLPAREVIEIRQQKMATILTVIIQVLALAGLVACIIVGPQDRPSPLDTPEARHGEYRPEGASSALLLIAGNQVSGGLPQGVEVGCHLGENNLSLHPMTICIAVGYPLMMA